MTSGSYPLLSHELSSWKSDNPTVTCLLTPLPPPSSAFHSGSFLTAHEPALTSSLFKQTKKQISNPLNLPAPFPSLAPCASWCHLPSALLFSLSLKPSLVRILPPFLFARIAYVSKSSVFCVAKLSASPVSSVLLNPVVHLHFSSYLNLK